MIYQDDLNRAIMVFGFQTFFIVVFLYMGLKVLKRGRSHQSILISFMYIFESLAFIVNLIYYFIYIEGVVFILYLFAYYFMVIAQVLLLITNIYIYYYPVKFRQKSQIALFTLLLTIFSLLLFIPSGITIGLSTQWKPVFNETFFLSLALSYTSMITIPNVYFSFKAYKMLTISTIKKRYRYYLFGIILFHSIFYWIIFYNTFNNDFLRLFQSLYHILVTIPGSLLLYYGMGKNMDTTKILSEKNS